MGGKLVQSFREASLIKKIISITSISLLLLLIIIFALRVFLINLILPYYLPEGAKASIGVLPIGGKGMGIQQLNFELPNTVKVTADRIFLGYPKFVDDGYGLSLIKVDNLMVKLPDQNIMVTAK